MLRRGMMAQAASGGTLYDEIMADSPAFYYRLNETSGTSAANATGGAAGTYSGATLAQPAIYTGGPVCARLSGGSNRVLIPSALLSPTSALTLGIVVKPMSVSGHQPILSRDPGSGTRDWQWRMNGAALEFVKIAGGVEVKTVAAVFAANVAAMLHVVVSGTSIIMYKNGVAILSTSIGSTTYCSSSGTEMAVGYQAGPAAGINAFVSEAFGKGAALSAARILAHAQAAGFA